MEPIIRAQEDLAEQHYILHADHRMYRMRIVLRAKKKITCLLGPKLAHWMNCSWTHRISNHHAFFPQLVDKAEICLCRYRNRVCMISQRKQRISQYNFRSPNQNAQRLFADLVVTVGSMLLTPERKPQTPWTSTNCLAVTVSPLNIKALSVRLATDWIPKPWTSSKSQTSGMDTKKNRAELSTMAIYRSKIRSRCLTTTSPAGRPQRAP
jgi:hypothetical protein